ncbi:MAG: cytochrome-c oxidase, cbb3-type subunit II [Campylobacterota bacterium]|nr:cytochrome-c oxidase, cbb3-type subunit II [Campylobacterota bacterium]
MFHWLEKRPFFFSVAVFVVVAFAGLVEILPNFAKQSQPTIGTTPYSTLELAGRHVYIKNSCNACHSQLIRPFKAETDRYGHYSISGEYAYDRPFLWGSKRTGPDLMRVGNYRTTDWHENHMWEPQAVVPGSIMPAYKWMFTNLADIDTAYAEMVTVEAVFNTPYNKPIPMKDGSTHTVKLAGNVAEANADALEEAKLVAADMKDQNVKDMVANGQIPEIVAIIAYMNSLK